MSNKSKPNIPRRRPKVRLTDRDKIILNHVYDIIREDFRIRYSQTFREHKSDGFFFLTANRPNVTIKVSVMNEEITLQTIIRMRSSDDERQFATTVYNIKRNHSEKAQMIYQKFLREVSDTSIIKDVR